MRAQQAYRRSSHPVLWLQILLVAGLACVVIVLVQSFRLARSNRSVVERAMHDYAGFAAWSYAQHLQVRIREATTELLASVNHGSEMHTNPGIPSAQELGHYLPEDSSCACHRLRRGPMPTRFLGFTLGSDTVAAGMNMAPASLNGWLADRPDGVPAVSIRLGHDKESRRLNELLTTAVRTGKSDWGYGVMVEPFEEGMRMIGVRPMATSWGDTIVYAFEYSHSAMDSLFRSVMSAESLLPPTILSGLPNDNVLELEVVDARGSSIYRNSNPRRWEPAVLHLPYSYANLSVRARLRPEMAEQILIGGVPQSRVPVLLLILFLAAGLTILAAVQLRREVRFAEERADFVANVSHELRTPLSQIRLALDTIRLGRAGAIEHGEHALAVADREALRLQHLVEGVLRYSRGARSSDTPRVSCDAAAEVRSVVAEFDVLAAPHNVSVTVSGDEVIAAPQRGAIRQILLNLLDNAVKYGGEGTRVRVHVQQLQGGGVRLSVEDNGPGVPESERQRIWRPFERGDAAHKRAAGGTGIGLTIVSQIAADHGGSARVQGVPGGGALFVVELPDEKS